MKEEKQWLTKQIRFAMPEDAKELVKLYNTYIETTTVTYEEEPVTAEAFAKRIASVQETYPFLVYEEEGSLLGYAYAARFKERASFRWDAEVTVYVKKGQTGRAVGTRLYEVLLPMLQKQGLINLYALLDYPNEASEALHRKFGFMRAGLYKDTAFKLGAWRSLLVMEKRLVETKETPKEIEKCQI